MPQKYLKDKTPTENLYLAIFNELPEHDMEAADIEELFNILDTLTPREEDVIKRRFGLTVARQTLKEIGNSYGVGDTRIGQIEIKAIRKLRHPYRKDHIKRLFIPRVDLRAEIKELKYQLACSQEHAARVEGNLARLTREYDLITEQQRAEKAKKAVLSLTIAELDLSVRATNCLGRAGYYNVHDLTQKTRSEVLKVRNLGVRSCDEVERKLEQLGLSFKPDKEDSSDRQAIAP